MMVKPVQANVDGTIGGLERRCQDICTWNKANLLKLNDGKTEVLLIGSRHLLSKVSMPGVSLGDSLILPSTTVRDLGAAFDTHITMISPPPHVNVLCLSGRYHVRNTGKIRRFLDRGSCERIVHALVTSRLDLSNAPLAGLPDDTVSKLQKCQIIAARTVLSLARVSPSASRPSAGTFIGCLSGSGLSTNTSCFSWSARHCMDLHQGTLLTFSSRIIQGRSLRSEGGLLLVKPFTRTSWRDRAFSKAAPVLWNDLPLTIKTAPLLASISETVSKHIFSWHPEQ